MPPLPDFEKAELSRLQEEIQKDRDLQFRVFWQATTVTAILFSLLANALNSQLAINFPFVFLVPHLILLPSSAIILNRARTGNRKNAYILTKFDSFAEFANWEKDLAFLRNFNRQSGEKIDTKISSTPPTRAHRAATLRSMILTITLLEILSLLLFYLFAYSHIVLYSGNLYSTLVMIIFCFLYASIYFSLVAKRLRSYFCTRYETSIQGYANIWAKVLGIKKSSITNFPEWEIKDWKKIRDSELSFKSPNSFLSINWSYFIWRLLYKKTKKQKTDSNETVERAKASWLKPILFAIAFTALILGIFHKTSVSESMEKNIKHAKYEISKNIKIE